MTNQILEYVLSLVYGSNSGNKMCNKMWQYHAIVPLVPAELSQEFVVAHFLYDFVNLKHYGQKNSQTECHGPEYVRC